MMGNDSARSRQVLPRRPHPCPGDSLPGFPTVCCMPLTMPKRCEIDETDTAVPPCQIKLEKS